MRKITVTKIVKTCTAYPAQWDGLTSGNRQIYIRFRHGCLSVRISNKGAMGEFDAVRGEEIYMNDKLDGGEMTYRKLKAHLADALKLPMRESSEVDWQNA